MKVDNPRPDLIYDAPLLTILLWVGGIGYVVEGSGLITTQPVNRHPEGTDSGKDE